MSIHSANIQAAPPIKSAMSKCAKPAHKSASKALGIALTLSTVDGWQGFGEIIEASLTETECATLAFIALRTLSDEALCAVARGLPKGAGSPIAPLYCHMDQAAFWADLATPSELDAYCLASFQGMAPARQQEFLSYVSERKAA